MKATLSGMVRVGLVGVIAVLLVGAGLPRPSAAADDVVYRGPDEHATIALTFDDGYAPQRCLEIADILMDFGVPATWFPNGVYVRSSPATWRSIGRRFPIANHTMHHPSLVGMSAKGIRKELLTNQRTIEQATGRPMLRLLRPTFGAYDERVIRAAGSVGYQLVMWSLSAADTSANGTDRGVARRALSGGPGSIILMHCGPEVTPRILPVVIARYACQGYRFATLDDLLAGRPGVSAQVTCPPPRLPAAPRRPGDKKVADPALAPFYAQTPTWRDCGQGALECATVDVPIDHADPDSGALGLRVQRLRATGTPEGSIVVGLDSAGASGVEDLLAFGTAVQGTLLPHFDLIGFDPRGTGASEPIACLDSGALDAFITADRTAEDGEVVASAQDMGAACLERAMPIAGHMSTVEMARDLDILRAVLGEKRLDYFGAGSGTLLGSTYAALFPRKIGAMVLDGVIDPRLSVPLRALGQAQGFERALAAYVEACTGAGDCPLGSTPDAALEAVAGLLERADEEPLPTGDPGRPLTQALAFFGITADLVAPDRWPRLSTALGAALDAGDGALLLRSADSAMGREPQGYGSNALEARTATACLDTQLVPDDTVPTLEEFLARSATFGAILHGLASTCDGWPLQPTVEAPSERAAGRAPILVIGTTRDPLTPYEWAVALAERLESGVLLTRDGDGHTSVGQGNACVDDAVSAYFVAGEVPPEGTTC